MPPEHVPTQRHYCLCGDKMEVSGSPHLVQRVLDWWEAHLTENGHGETDAATARKARNKRGGA